MSGVRRRGERQDGRWTPACCFLHLMTRSANRLDYFGSVTRGEAGPSSDVDRCCPLPCSLQPSPRERGRLSEKVARREKGVLIRPQHDAAGRQDQSAVEQVVRMPAWATRNKGMGYLLRLECSGYSSQRRRPRNQPKLGHPVPAMKSSRWAQPHGSANSSL